MALRPPVCDMRCAVQILGDGELAMPLVLHATQFSASARAKIEAAGGSIVEVPAKVGAVVLRAFACRGGMRHSDMHALGSGAVVVVDAARC